MMRQGSFPLPAFRGLQVVAALAVAHLLPAVAQASAPATAVVAVESARAADLVLLGHGFNAGLRQGMVCRVTRGGIEIGEVLLVGLRPTASAALILSVAPKHAIRPGDTVSAKVLKS